MSYEYSANTVEYILKPVSLEQRNVLRYMTAVRWAKSTTQELPVEGIKTNWEEYIISSSLIVTSIVTSLGCEFG